MSRFLDNFNRRYAEFFKKKIVLIPSQRELLKLLAAGYTLKKIAEMTGKNYNNIHKRTNNLYKKFEVKNRLELISKAIKEKIINSKDIKPLFRKRFVKKADNSPPKVYLPPDPPLQENEITFLKLAGQGKTLDEIIQLMGLRNKYCAWTIRSTICAILSCKNITEAVYIARKLEII